MTILCYKPSRVPVDHEDMLASSIADIQQLREQCFYLGLNFIQPNTSIVDVGSGYGDAIKPFIDACDTDISFHLIDKKPLRSSIQALTTDCRVDIHRYDASRTYPMCSASLTLLICTLQHTPIRSRLRVLRNIYNSTVNGGALLFVDRVASSNPLIENIFSSNMAVKLINNGNFDAVDDAKSLTSSVNEKLLRRSGFQTVETFYRNNNYHGWIAIKND